MKRLTRDEILAITDADHRFKQDNYDLRLDGEMLEDHIGGIRDCMLLLATLRQKKAPGSHSMCSIKHIIEDLSGRYVCRGEVFAAAKALGIPDDGQFDPILFLHDGDVRRLQELARNHKDQGLNKHKESK